MKLPQQKIANYVRIGEIIPKYQLTVTIGLPGTGKTHTLIKFFNEQNITPILINLDETPVDKSLKARCLEGSVVKHLLNDEFDDLEDKVIIIDTYQLMMTEIGNQSNTDEEQAQVSQILVHLAKEKKVTIVVIGHTEDFASKEGIFTANKYLIRDAAEVLIMGSKIMGGVGKKKAVYETTVKKGRGIGGSHVLAEWMRDTE